MKKKFALAIAIIFVAIIVLLVLAEGIEERPQSLFVVIALTLASVGGFMSYYEYRGVGPQEGIIRRGPRFGEKVVSLTFDDGPSPVYTPKILDVLKEHKVKATFFVTGRHVKKYPEIARRIVKEGHDIGNHSYSHCNMILLNEKQLFNEISQAEQAIVESTGLRPVLFRPPRGIYNNRVRQRVLAEGYRIVLWSVSSLDWSFLSPKAIAFRVRQFVRNGSIILLHDGGSLVKREGGSRKGTVHSLPLIISFLKSRDYQIVPVSELVTWGEEESCLDEIS